ncbi:Serine/threonine-protein kinase PrkC [Acaryochloris thomasi RCC1774]|uniref:Serine/threonine-protein kinase PrkC n=2 Tax=Acaryochloris TaxID=155977 RepID=A0A2W1JMA5_9CYAN|nr:Serine/threonine-protein kinase PrkC [Acaryochloris thomasi RCC1774]
MSNSRIESTPLMALSIEGYQCLEKIYDSCKTLVYRGVCSVDHQSVIIKVPKKNRPTETEIIRFRNQYSLVHSLIHPGIVKLYRLDLQQNSCVLIMEDFGAMSLQDHLENRGSLLPLPEFYAIALQIVEALIELHEHCIIHKDLKPQNVLINPQTGVVKLSDFCIASRLPKEVPQLESPTTLEGTPAYMSPEQTGRMNRGIDYRTDLYSLGILFFNLLTGKLPFHADRLMGWIHCHIAQRPPRLDSLNSDVPPMLSAMVEKLLSKDAEDRYQSALGLKHDLQRCQQDSTATFPLGRQDCHNQFVIPEQLYGRESEVNTLLTAFDRVTHQQKEMVWVAGSSGVGKTALVHEVQKSIVRGQGYFIEGKFALRSQSQPFSAFISALRNFVKQILTEDEAVLQQWKVQLLSAVGQHGQLLIDVIPELEQILGAQPSVPAVSGTAAQNRFNHVLQELIRAFAQAEHPLVVFIDNLQWADPASLDLFERLMTDSQIESLLLIGAYRDHEVDADHPLLSVVDHLEAVGVQSRNIDLLPLDLPTLNIWVAAALHCQPVRVLPLTQCIFQHTRGNPFFSAQFLQALVTEGLIHRSSMGSWQYDLQRVASLELSQNAVGFVVQRLHRLPKMTQRILHFAACIGNRFDLKTLALVCECSEAGVASHLNQALHEGLIVPLSEMYKLYYLRDDQDQQWSFPSHSVLCYQFLHNSVQQAAYALIPEQQQAAIHLRMGRLLRREYPQAEIALTQVVTHLNQGASLISSISEKLQLIQLNLEAGVEAKEAIDAPTALRYFNTGIKLLPKQSWQTHYDLTLQIFTEAVEAAYLCAQYDELEQLADQILGNAVTDLDALKVHEARILAYAAQNKPLAAIQVALVFLQRLGISFPDTPEMGDITAGLQKTAALVDTVGTENFKVLPMMDDPVQLAKMLILSRVWPTAYIAGSPLVPLIVFELLQLTVTQGRSPFSAFAAVTYGLILCGMTGEIETGYNFGELALELQARDGHPEFEPIILGLMTVFVRHFRDSLQSTLGPLRQTYQVALSVGNVEYAAYAAHHYGEHAFFAGQELNQLLLDVEQHGDAISTHQQLTVLCYNDMLRQMILNLLGQNRTPWQLEGSAYDQTVLLPHHQQTKDILALFYLDFKAMILAYLFQRKELALACALRAEPYIAHMTGMLDVPIFYFYDSLIHLAHYPDAADARQTQILIKVAANQAHLEKYAKHAPTNYRHRLELVIAERYRVLQEPLLAMDHFELALTYAQDGHYIQDVALANELVAQLHCTENNIAVSQAYLAAASDSYQQWGAQAKAEALAQMYPQRSASSLPFSTVGSDSTLNAVGTFSATIQDPVTAADTGGVGSLLHAVESLNGEQSRDALLLSLLGHAVQQTHADVGQLLLPQQTGWMTTVLHQNGSTHLLQQPTPLPEALLQYVERTQTALVLDDVSTSIFAISPYIKQHQPRSILCVPILQRTELTGLLYLENRQAIYAFHEHQTEALKLLTAHAAVVMETLQLRQSYQGYSLQLEQAQSEVLKLHGQVLAGIHHDSLTGLLSRAWLMDRLPQVIGAGHQIAILLIDINNFNVVNHQFGYQAGDQLLQTVAHCLRSCLRQQDRIVRWGGDQFAIVLENLQWRDEPMGLAERIQTLFASPLKTDLQQQSVNVTIGILCDVDKYKQTDEVLKDLWSVLIQAKANHEDGYVVHMPIQQDGATA